MKALKIIGLLAVLLVGLLTIGLTYLKVALPDVGEIEEITIKGTDEQISRGSYLANSVAVCMDCHSRRDWTKFAGPPIPEFWGAGGEVFDQSMGFPGKFYSRNITPHGLNDLSDQEIFKAIVSGVRHDGKALFPVMPYLSYGRSDKEDIKSIIAYLRTLPSVPGDAPESVPDFPMSLIINTIPSTPTFQKRPDETDAVAHGKYLLNMAACADCHTPKDQGKPVPGKMLAGGFQFQLPTGGIVSSSNITPHETGIKNMSADDFVARFKTYADSSYNSPTIKPGEFNTVMPWLMYSSMKESDLRAIYAYLQTVEPVDNEPVRFEPPTK